MIFFDDKRKKNINDPRNFFSNTFSNHMINNFFQNGHNHDLSQFLADGEVSPSSLRRSTRASALKAQEKLKIKEGMGLFSEVS